MQIISTMALYNYKVPVIIKRNNFTFYSGKSRLKLYEYFPRLMNKIQGLSRTRNFFFYHGFADLLRHIRILSILRAHLGLIRCIHRQINARGRLAYRLVITGKYA